MRSLQLAALLSCLTGVLALSPRPPHSFPKPAIPKPPEPSGSPVVSRNGTQLPPYTTWYHFQQLVDHDDPSQGTFDQRFYFTYEFYEPGGPIVLMTPGEINAEGYSSYLTNATINGLFASDLNAATIVLEHRFYGFSNPKPDLTDESLALHTIAQATADLEYFAKNAVLPMPGGDQVTPDKAPWILVGGSYSGALTSWTMVQRPGVFWAGYASSAVVEAITYFWAYFEPVRLNAPQNCTSDVQRVLTHFDEVFTSNDTDAINALKAQFGMQNVTHLDDVAGSLRNNLWDWQSLNPQAGHAQFFQFCDALELGSDGKTAPADGFGLDHALNAWGSYFTNTYLPGLCGNQSREDCLGSYDLSLDYWHNTTIDNDWRSWFWIVCNEVGFLQDGAPSDWPSLVSRLIQPAYDIRQCSYYFPDRFPTITSAQPAENRTNEVLEGWNVNQNRLFFANGQRDPWRYATVSSPFHPRNSTADQPIYVSDGFHCSDLLTRYGTTDPTIATVQNAARGFMAQWIKEFPGSNSTVPSRTIPPPPAVARPSIPPSRVTGLSPTIEPAVTPSAPASLSKDAKPAIPNAWSRKVIVG